MRIMKVEGLLRLLSLVSAVIASCLLGFNKETQVVLVERTATVKDIGALWVLTVVATVAGGYQLLQFCNCLIRGRSAKNRSESRRWEAWVSFAFDQVMIYVVLAAIAAAMQGSLLALSGQKELGWIKLGDIYKRFTHQVTGGLASALMASAAMSLISILSAHQAFSIFPSDSKSTPY